MSPPSKKGADRAATKAQRRGRARMRQAFLASRTERVDARAVHAAMARRLSDGPAAGGFSARASMPTSDVQRWVPIGPSVVLWGQAEGSPRVTGRIRDLAVSDDGRRAYAASAKGGVWYTEDAGFTWSPVGGWSTRTAALGGSNNAQTCGCLLVAFGNTSAQDYVMVGTGELIPDARHNRPVQGGLGVLAARGPVHAAGDEPWEPETGLQQLEGLGIYRLVRHPTAIAGQATAGAELDRVLAATSAGLFLGTRSTRVDPPQNDSWTWSQIFWIGTLELSIQGVYLSPLATITDVLWMDNGSENGRLVIAVHKNGVAISDDLGVTWTWVEHLEPWPPNLPFTGRISLASPDKNRIYVLGELLENGTPIPTLWVIYAATGVGTPEAINLTGLPSHEDLWAAQQDYDQALAVEPGVGVDHVYVGGSTIQPFSNADWSASLWCYDVPVPAQVGTQVVPTPNVSTIGPDPGAGADRPGLIGNNVHADVHAIRFAGPSGQVWVACDGGVFVSASRGRYNTFLSRSTGLGVLEVGFHASHPTSSHFMAIGCHDNGTQVRSGDTVWEMIASGDGGGTIFHPIHSQFIISQYTNGHWRSRPPASYVDPISRTVGDYSKSTTDREDELSAFYSGAAAVRIMPIRLAGTTGPGRPVPNQPVGTRV